jgi:3-hydroxyacyl-[acyl-carrier-protein] dehydratase
MSLTPHGSGFSFLDAFEVTIPGREGCGRKWLDPKLAFFADHFPGQPLMPGVLLVECAAQAAGALWASTLAAKDAPAHFTLAQIIQFKLLRSVKPGDTVEAHVILDKAFGELTQFDAALQVSGADVARGRIVLALPSASGEKSQEIERSPA